MNDRIKIVEVIRLDGYGIVVDFSDRTTARYTVEELANMRPSRELTPEEYQTLNAENQRTGAPSRYLNRG